VAILIDPPSWPAHGTLFSHLISDTSLAELHAFAAAAGIPERAFDEDHYDVPERRYGDLVALGAGEVSGAQLTRALISSGLRVPARLRNSKLETSLLSHWNLLLPDREALGRDLIARWGEPHRRYHDRTHLLAVLEALGLLSTMGEEPSADRRAILLAAWFHDAVYDGVPGGDEEASARLAEKLLPEADCPAAEVSETARLVRLTAHHAPERDDRAGALLCDADLSILGGTPGRYARYLRQVRLEYSHVSDADFARGRAAVVERLLALEPLFHTPAAQRLWLDQAQSNLRSELAAWGH
jgi:predicted metal-dependent HD superfamily phosphohydrolase